MAARIYKPAKTAMQSGDGRMNEWVLDREPARPGEIDPLMGYTGTTDTQAQVKLTFPSLEEAVAYAEKHGIPYRVVEPNHRQPIRKTYADNFRYGRVGSWTH